MKPAMTFKSNFKNLCLVLLLGTVGGCATDADRKTETREPPLEAFKNADDFLTVDCQLPGEIIQIGMYKQWVTPPRPAVISALQCKINGGQYAIGSDKNGREKALDVWQESANQGDKVAQNYMGEIYGRSWGEIKPDYAQAAGWYHKSAEQGYSRAQNNLGFLYERGLGVAQNKQLALELYRKAMGAVEPIKLDQNIKNEINALKSNLDRALQTTKDLQKQLSEREELIQKQQKEINNLRQMHDGARGKQAQLEKMQNELAKNQSQERALRGQLSDAQQKIDTLSSQLTKTKTQVAFKNIPDMGKYYALIIGINNYQSPPADLTTPVKDAKRVEEVLHKKYGFETILLVDDGRIKPTRNAIFQALADLKKKIKNDDNLLIYFAGHGEFIGGSGYWLPQDAQQENLANWLSTDDLTKQIQYLPKGTGGLKARHVLVVADSCFGAAMATSWLEPLKEQIIVSLPEGLVTRSSHSMPVGSSQVEPALSLQPDGESAEISTGYIKKQYESPSRIQLSSGGLEPVIDKEFKKGLSVFANAFTEALEANEGIISAEHIYHKIKPQVFERVRAMGLEQTPVYQRIQNAGSNNGEFFFVVPH